MRIPTHALLIAAFVATPLAAVQPALALTADEKREKSRLSDARRASLTRKAGEVRFAFAEECEAAFAAGEPMPELDVRITEEIEIDDDLMSMSVEEISEQYGLASNAFSEAERAMKDCILKYRKRNDGS
ncbi:hypothetical protein [Ruegeria sp. MALMAid1280]|uniref:hypothetical protein n=1 Tax=Ruegeria sp. MALMAid1280 TaxID=3411634 RepID=UPI003B9E8757